jgi:hypothetical protein
MLWAIYDDDRIPLDSRPMMTASDAVALLPRVGNFAVPGKATRVSSWMRLTRSGGLGRSLPATSRSGSKCGSNPATASALRITVAI